MYKIMKTVFLLFYLFIAAPGFAQSVDILRLNPKQNPARAIDNALLSIAYLSADQCNAKYIKLAKGAWKYVKSEPRSLNASRQYLRRGMENFCLAKKHSNEILRLKQLIINAKAEISYLDQKWANAIEADPTIRDYSGRRSSQLSMERDIRKHNESIESLQNDIVLESAFAEKSFELAVNASPSEAADLIRLIFGPLPVLG